MVQKADPDPHLDGHVLRHLPAIRRVPRGRLYRYEWFGRDYTHKKARDGAGAETDTYRKDARYRGRYKVGTTMKKALLSVENDFYKNDSNDNRNNYYDYEVWKITGSASGSATKKLYLSGSFAFERKNYDVRPVSGITAEARYDDKYTIFSLSFLR